MANTSGHPDTLKPFQKGDPRINRKGRPKSFDALRKLAQSIAHEPARGMGKDGAPGNPLIIDGHIATVAEMIMRQWATSKDPRLVQAFIAYAFGKVPDNVDITSKGESIKETDADGKGYDRSVSQLANVLREALSGSGTAPDSPVDPAK